MAKEISDTTLAEEGYVYSAYGSEKYLKHAVASVTSLRRYDKKRPAAIYCSSELRACLEKSEAGSLFEYVFDLPDENQSINGFKHNIHLFMPFERNLILDSDMIWCKNPDRLWLSLSPFPFTITGNQLSDLFFGSSKGISVIKDLILNKRKKTLDRFGLTYLSRVQAGMIYAQDPDLARRVSDEAKTYFSLRNETHFRSRTDETGRIDESCEWSMAMAMSKMKLQVFPWLNGFESPQLDFLESYTEYDPDFHSVSCLYYTQRLVYDLKGLKSDWFRNLLIRLITKIPGRGDYLYVTPYCIHFGWVHQKEPLNQFSVRCWSAFKKRNSLEKTAS